MTKDGAQTNDVGSSGHTTVFKTSQTPNPGILSSFYADHDGETFSRFIPHLNPRPRV